MMYVYMFVKCTGLVLCVHNFEIQSGKLVLTGFRNQDYRIGGNSWNFCKIIHLHDSIYYFRDIPINDRVVHIENQY